MAMESSFRVVLPPSELQAELEALYAQVTLEIRSLGVACWNHSVCCDFERCDHKLFASSVEIAHVLAAHPEPMPDRGALCPFWQDGRCLERERRPLGCRTYFCDGRYRLPLEDIHGKYHHRLRILAEKHSFPWYYGLFVPALVERTVIP